MYVHVILSRYGCRRKKHEEQKNRQKEQMVRQHLNDIPKPKLEMSKVDEAAEHSQNHNSL